MCSVITSPCKSARSVAGNGPRLVDQDALHLWSFLRLQGRRLWLCDRQVRLREWGLRRQGQRRVPLWAYLQVRQRLLRVLHGQVLQHGQLPTGPCDHPPPTRLLGAASRPERSPPPPLLGCRREHLVVSPTSPMPLPVSTRCACDASCPKSPSMMPSSGVLVMAAAALATGVIIGMTFAKTK